MTGGAGKYTYEWKLQGFVVGTTSTYTVPTGTAVGSVISVSVTDADGISATDSVVTVEKKVELPDDQIEGAIKIEDISGLQSDGTGLVGDWLRAVVPATLGSFSNVIFYRDGIQLNSTTQNGAAMEARADRPGKYTVSVIGSDNKVYLSDSIDVVDKEAPAVIKSFSIEDDYDTPNIDVLGPDSEAVITVSLNKAYNGTIALYKSSDLKYQGAPDVSRTTALTATSGGATDVDASTTMPTVSQVTALTDGNILRYVDPETGVATYKWTVAAGLARAITSDTPGQGKENVFGTTATAPYVTAPASLAIDSAADGQPVVISFKDKNGNTLTWLGSQNPTAPTAANTFLGQLKVYSKNNGEMKDGTDLGATPAGSNIVRGVMTTNAVGDTNAFYYATAKTVTGLFGAKALDLASSLGVTAQPAATGISIAQDSTDPYSAKITFQNLRADGTLYIVQSSDNTTNLGTNDDMITGLLAGTYPSKVSQKVTSATKEVVLGSAIDEIAGNKNHYQAVFVPDDTKNYSTVATNTGTTHGLLVVPTLTKYAILGKNSLAHANTSLAWSSDADVFDATTETVLQQLDQFGKEMITPITAIPATPMTADNPTVSNGLLTNFAVARGTDATGDGAKYGVITIVSTSGTAPAAKGASYSLKLATGQTIKATYDLDKAVWKLSLN